jgi:hypothetical protein
VEASPPTISASGRGRRRLAGALADRVGASLSVAASAPSRQRAVPVIGDRSGGSAGALLPPRSAMGLHETGYVEGQIVIILGLSFLDTLRRTEHVARGSLWKRFDVTAQ